MNSESSEKITHTFISPRLKQSSLNLTLFFVFLITCLNIYFWRNNDIQSFLTASKHAISAHQEFWKLFTTNLVHADEKHLLSNSFLFVIFGWCIHSYFGFFAFPFLPLLIGGLISGLTLQQMSPETSLIGLSGIVFWMGGFWLILYFLIDTTRSIKSRLLRVTGLALAVFAPAEAFDPSISYYSHFVGFSLGILSGGIYFLKNRRLIKKAEVRVQIIEPQLEQIIEPQLE